MLSAVLAGVLCFSILSVSANAMTRYEKIKKFEELHRELVMARKDYDENPYVYQLLKAMGLCVLLAERYLIDGKLFNDNGEQYDIEKCTEMDINYIIFSQIKETADERGMKKPSTMLFDAFSDLYKDKELMFCLGWTDDNKHVYGIFYDAKNEISLEKVFVGRN